jgi:hypothetical protein
MPKASSQGLPAASVAPTAMLTPFKKSRRVMERGLAAPHLFPGLGEGVLFFPCILRLECTSVEPDRDRQRLQNVEENLTIVSEGYGNAVVIVKAKFRCQRATN